jgi:hypothetical protein
MLARAFSVSGIDAFDLTPAMLNRFRQSLKKREIRDVRLAEVDVLKLETLPISGGPLSRRILSVVDLAALEKAGIERETHERAVDVTHAAGESRAVLA